MSIGPDPKMSEPTFSVTAQATYLTKKTLSAFFESPIRYIFYITLCMTLAGLFFGKTFSWQYWLLFISLTSFHFVDYINEKEYEEIIEKK